MSTANVVSARTPADLPTTISLVPQHACNNRHRGWGCRRDSITLTRSTHSKVPRNRNDNHRHNPKKHARAGDPGTIAFDKHLLRGEPTRSVLNDDGAAKNSRQRWRRAPSRILKPAHWSPSTSDNDKRFAFWARNFPASATTRLTDVAKTNATFRCVNENQQSLPNDNLDRVLSCMRKVSLAV